MELVRRSGNCSRAHATRARDVQMQSNRTVGAAQRKPALHKSTLDSDSRTALWQSRFRAGVLTDAPHCRPGAPASGRIPGFRRFHPESCANPPMTADLQAIEQTLWATADRLWANTGLKPSEFSTPVLGLIFLRYAERRFADVHTALLANGHAGDDLEKFDYVAEGALYLPEMARFSNLLLLPEGANLGKAINEAMAAVERENVELAGVLPRGFNKLDNATLVELLRLLGPVDLAGDAFGKVYEYFLGNFALKEGQKGGVFYTPTSIVQLIVEIIEPYHGRILDPACGSGGMFVQSAAFVERHHKRPSDELVVFGTEKASDTVKLAKMNLAVHGLSGNIIEANTYYDDPHKLLGRFDFVMANPPFNVSGVSKDRVAADKRFPFGVSNCREVLLDRLLERSSQVARGVARGPSAGNSVPAYLAHTDQDAMCRLQHTPILDAA